MPDTLRLSFPHVNIFLTEYTFCVNVASYGTEPTGIRERPRHKRHDAANKKDRGSEGVVAVQGRGEAD